MQSIIKPFIYLIWLADKTLNENVYARLTTQSKWIKLCSWGFNYIIVRIFAGLQVTVWMRVQPIIKNDDISRNEYTAVVFIFLDYYNISGLYYEREKE